MDTDIIKSRLELMEKHPGAVTKKGVEWLIATLRQFLALHDASPENWVVQENYKKDGKRN
jgi:hypothetical protein